MGTTAAQRHTGRVRTTAPLPRLNLRSTLAETHHPQKTTRAAHRRRHGVAPHVYHAQHLHSLQRRRCGPRALRHMNLARGRWAALVNTSNLTEYIT